MKPILDACCGGRMFYFDKNNPNVLFADIRNQKLSFKDRDKIRHLEVSPDYVEPQRYEARYLGHFSIQNGNCFRTREDAQKWLDFMKSMME